MIELTDNLKNQNNDMKSHLLALEKVGEIKDILSVFKDKKDYSYRRNLLREMPFDDFKRIIVSLNGCYNDNRGRLDGEDYAFSGTASTLYTDDKEYGMSLVFDQMKKYINDDELTDLQSLMYASVIISCGGLIVHPFRDGNGRTHRLLFDSIINGCPNEERIALIVGDHTEGESISPIGLFKSGNCARYIIKKYKAILESEYDIDTEEYSGRYKDYSFPDMYYLHMLDKFNPKMSREEYLNTLSNKEKEELIETFYLLKSRMPLLGFIEAVSSNDIIPMGEIRIFDFEYDNNMEEYERFKRFLNSYFGYDIADEEYNIICEQLPCIDRSIIFCGMCSKDFPLLDKPLYKGNTLDEEKVSLNK